MKAVRCATEIQTALRTRNDHLAPEQRLWFRIGINLGDIIVQGGDLLGDGVNVAARIQTVAGPRGICMSGSVYDQIENKLTLHIKQLGEKTFKNIAKPIRIFSISDDAVSLPAGMRWRALHKGPLVTVAAIVVGFIAVAATGYWLYSDYKLRVAESQAKAEQERAAQASADRETKLLAELQSAKDALRQAEASKRKAEQDRLVTEPAQPETRLQGELKSANAYASRGLAWLNKGDWDRTIADFDAVIKPDSKNAFAYRNRGIAHPCQRGEIGGSQMLQRRKLVYP